MERKPPRPRRIGIPQILGPIKEKRNCTVCRFLKTKQEYAGEISAWRFVVECIMGHYDLRCGSFKVSLKHKGNVIQLGALEGFLKQQCCKDFKWLQHWLVKRDDGKKWHED